MYDYLTTESHIHIRYGFWGTPVIIAGRPLNGTVLFLNGRSEFMEKHMETVSRLNVRGFDVFGMDWRGQGLSTRLLSNPHKGFVHQYEDYLLDLHMLVEKIIRPRVAGKLILVTHSMGGNIGFRYLHAHPDVFDRAVMVSPMIDIVTDPFPVRLGRFIVHMAMFYGMKELYAPGGSDYFPGKVVFEGNDLTTDPVRFQDTDKAIARNPDLALGGVTYGWLNASFDSIDLLKSPEYGAAITTPVMIASAAKDTVVSIPAQEALCAAMPACRFESIPEARHEVLKETDAIQAVFWKLFDVFTGSPDPKRLQRISK